MFEQYDIAYLKLLSEQFENIPAVSSEIIRLRAMLELPKGTEHYLSDLHGEHEAFSHILRNASGIIRERIDELFSQSMPQNERNALAMLIYYPKRKLSHIKGIVNDLDDWYRVTLPRLIEVCRLTATKYTRDKVHHAMPPEFGVIIEELIFADDSNHVRQPYYKSIVQSIIDTGSSDAFIIAIAGLIQRFATDALHIIGDIYDRGAGPHIILDELMAHHQVDVQWGNHDILWMGAAMGNRACIATAVVNCLKYNNTDVLEDGYGISLRPLAIFALNHYEADACAKFMPGDAYAKGVGSHDRALIAKMHKAMAIVMFKLEAKLIEEHPEYGMNHHAALNQCDFINHRVVIDGKWHPLIDVSFPTIDAANPTQLTQSEERLMRQMAFAFLHSEKLQRHTRFLFEHGGMYLVRNNNLLYHGCIPTEENGAFTEVDWNGKILSGRAYITFLEGLARRGYGAKRGTEQHKRGVNLMWYLWCGAKSPVYGKSDLTAFYRYFVADTTTWEEQQNPYYRFVDDEAFVTRILEMFELYDPEAKIVNGHVPVIVRKGETPIKAGGKLLVIDGGLSKAYQGKTGIAGYTLIYDSHGMHLEEHEPFVSVDESIVSERDLHSKQIPLMAAHPKKLVGDTDLGCEIRMRIEALKYLLLAYRQGVLKENSDCTYRG